MNSRVRPSAAGAPDADEPRASAGIDVAPAGGAGSAATSAPRAWGVRRSSASRKSRCELVANAAPKLRAADEPAAGWRTTRASGAARRAIPNVSSSEPSSTTISSSAGRVCACTLAIASGSRCPWSRQAITTATLVRAGPAGPAEPADDEPPAARWRAARRASAVITPRRISSSAWLALPACTRRSSTTSSRVSTTSPASITRSIQSRSSAHRIVSSNTPTRVKTSRAATSEVSGICPWWRSRAAKGIHAEGCVAHDGSSSGPSRTSRC